MRVMNGRLHNLVRSPLIKNKYLNDDHYNNLTMQNHVGANHHPTKGFHNRHKRQHRSGKSNNSDGSTWRRQSADVVLPRSVQFDESSDSYRCLCGCFHIKTGAMCIAAIEIFLILCYFINALLVVLQQKSDYVGRPSGKADPNSSSDYVQLAFIITVIGLVIALFAVFLMLIGLSRSVASLLIPHLLIQAISILCFTGLLLIGATALITDNALFYRLLNAAPFNDYPGQSTVALPVDIAVRVYAVLTLYALSLAFECWFIVVVYHCNRYITERRTYMNYCLAYSTPMKTLNSAR